jgi:hypothetical protein
MEAWLGHGLLHPSDDSGRRLAAELLVEDCAREGIGDIEWFAPAR